MEPRHHQAAVDGRDTKSGVEMKATEHQSASASATSASRQSRPFFSKGGRDVDGSGRDMFFHRSPVQAKLSVGQPNDKYEQEADAMADKVVQRLSSGDSVQTKMQTGNSITPIVQMKCDACEKEEKLQKKEEPEKEKEETKLQRKPIFESPAKPQEEINLQRKCDECEKEDEEKLQAKFETSGPSDESSSIENKLSISKGSGESLPETSRNQMETAFGADFSNVRVHNDSHAVQMNRDLHAQAFTHGSDIYFNQGKFDLGNKGGHHLLAHELTHVLQQGQSNTVQRSCDPTISSCIPKSYSSCNPNITSCPQPISSQPNDNPLELIPSQSSGSFLLVPIANPPSILMSDVTDGGMVTYAGTPMPTLVQGNMPSLKAEEFLGPGSSVLLSSVNQSLMNSGFSSISGGNGIGLIAIPRLGSVGGMIPESMSTWGHTAAYVRIGGQIKIVRGFTVESLIDAAANAKSVPAGQSSIPGVISNDIKMFTITNARTVEWPVTADVAKGMADSMPAPGTPPSTMPGQYTGRPGVFGPGASNCVGYACNAAEGGMGAKISTPKLGNIAEPANAAEGLQGRMMQLTKTASSDISPAGAVTSSMPLKFVVLKWGGRLFLVLGAALTVKQVLTASGEHRREEQGQAFGSFAGGTIAGAFAAGFCVGAGIATGGIALLVCAGIAGVAGAVGGHYAGGAVGRQFDK
jgi:hypothetical protein